MNIRTILSALLATVILSAMADTSASARTRHHQYRHHGYGALAQHRGHAPTGPSSQNFELGSGWNNGSTRHPQYGRPDHS